MRFFLLGMIVCLACCSALAQQTDPNAPATMSDVERYFSVVHSHQMVSQLMDAMSKPMHKMVHDQYLKDKDKLPSDFEEREDKNLEAMFSNVPWDEVMKAMMPAYKKHFTKGDIDTLIAFYSSPTGQKLLRELPAIMGESMEAAMPIIQKYTESVRQRIEGEFTEALNNSEKKPN